jgi:hypothetical protein
LFRLFHMAETEGIAGALFAVDEVQGPPPRKPHVRSKRVFRAYGDGEFTSLNPGRELPADHVARAIKEGLLQLDLSFLELSYEDHGGIPYNPLPMLGILLLGYSMGITSERQLQESCLYDFRFIHVSDGYCPDDRTIGRFVRRLGSHLKPLWKAVNAASNRQQGSRKRRIGVDGTKLASAAAPVKVTKQERENAGEVSLDSTDPEAAFRKGRGGLVYGYNLQAIVDLDTHEVLYTEVVDDKCDRNQLEPMLKAYLEVSEVAPEIIVADTGYDDGNALAACMELGVEPIVPAQNSYAFWTVVDDEVMCPMGHAASVTQPKEERGTKVIIHSVPESCCRDCIFRTECLGNSRRKTLTGPENGRLADRVLAAQRARGPDGKQAMTDRKSHVEPFFGRIKWNKRTTRLRLRGKQGARIALALFGLCETIARLGSQLWDHFLLIFRPRNACQSIEVTIYVLSGANHLKAA